MWTGRKGLVALIGASLVALTLTPAMADESTAPVQAKPLPEGITCVWRPTLRNGYFNVLDNRHLVLEAMGKKYYLVTFGAYCQDLDTDLALRFESHGDQLCTGDTIITDRDRCIIDYVEPVQSTAEAKSIVAARELARKQAKQGGH